MSVFFSFLSHQASSINSCQTAALMLSTNGDNYVLSLNIKPSNGDDNQLNIQIPNKKIGEKLEKFLDEYGFMEYLDEEKSILNATTTTTATNIDDNDMNKDQKFDYRILEKSIDDDDWCLNLTILFFFKNQNTTTIVLVAVVLMMIIYNLYLLDVYCFSGHIIVFGF